jgi:hypothetical protein
VAAALFALREIKNNGGGDLPGISKQEELLKGLLKRVNQHNLSRFTIDYALINPEFRASLFLHFASSMKESGEEKYRILVDSIINAAEKNGGIKKMIRQLHAILEEARKQLAVKNYIDPFHVAKTIITEMVKVAADKKDDLELFSEIIEEAFAIFEMIQEADAGYDLKEALFELAMQQSEGATGSSNTFTSNWLNLAALCATDLQRQERVLASLDRHIGLSKSHSSHPKHEFFLEDILKRKISLLIAMGRKDDASQIVEDNLRIESFRLQRIQESIDQSAFGAAKELIRGSKLADRQKGVFYESSKWDHLLLDIALRENDVRNIRLLALRLYQSEHQLRYYRIIKDTYPPAEWKAQREKIIDSIRSDRYFSMEGIKSLAVIFEEEQDWPRLLKLVQKNASLHFAESYYDLLKEKYPEELLDITKKHCAGMRSTTWERNITATSQATIRKIQSLPRGNETAKSLAIEFKVKYRQRKNLVNALNKLVF